MIFPSGRFPALQKGTQIGEWWSGETGSGESRVPGAPPSCLLDCQWVPFMTSFSLIECHILCYSGIGTIEEATKYFFSGQPSFNWILVRAVRTKSLQSCLILCDPVDCQAPLSKGFSRQDSWSGLPFPPPGDLPDPGRQSSSLMSPALAGGFFMTSATWESLPGYTFTKLPLWSFCKNMCNVS